MGEPNLIESVSGFEAPTGGQQEQPQPQAASTPEQSASPEVSKNIQASMDSMTKVSGETPKPPRVQFDTNTHKFVDIPGAGVVGFPGSMSQDHVNGAAGALYDSHVNAPAQPSDDHVKVHIPLLGDVKIPNGTDVSKVADQLFEHSKKFFGKEMSPEELQRAIKADKPVIPVTGFEFNTPEELQDYVESTQKPMTSLLMHGESMHDALEGYIKERQERGEMDNLSPVQKEFVKVLEGAGLGGAAFVDSMSTPETAMTLVALAPLGASKIVNKLVAAGFGSQMAITSATGIVSGYKKFQDGDTEGAVEDWTNALFTGAMARESTKTFEPNKLLTVPTRVTPEDVKAAREGKMGELVRRQQSSAEAAAEDTRFQTAQEQAAKTPPPDLTPEEEAASHQEHLERAGVKGMTPEGANFSNEEIARQTRGERYYTISKSGDITAQMSQPDAASDLKGGVVVKTLPDGTMDVQRGDSSILDKYRDRLNKAIEPPKKMSVSEDLANWDKFVNPEPETEHVQIAFPTSDVSKLTDSSWKVKTPAGHDIIVVKTPEVSTEGSGITLKNNQYAAGSWQQVDTGGIMHLAKIAGQDTVHHEAFHAAWDLALDEADRKAITNRYGSEEAAAEAYGKWNPQAEPHTFFEKIQNYFRRMYNSVVSPDKNLFADVRSGKVWEEASDRRVTNDSSINFSITTKPKWEAQFSKLAPTLGGLDESQIAKAKSAVNEVSSVMESMKDILPLEEKGLKGEAAKPIKKNQDYLRTVDMNTICPRTNRFQGTIDGIQKNLGRMLSGDERLDVAKNMQQQGHTSPCAYCYVEQGRNRMVNRVKRLASEAGVPERALFDDKFKQQLIADNPKMAKAIEAVQTEAKKPMMVNIEKPYKPYTNQILKWDQPLVDEINGRAGLRFFSSTDFQPEHMLDLMQVVSDAGARGLKAHGYTKEPDFVRTFGNTGIKINMSIHAHGGVEGSPIIMESPESMPWKDAQQLRKQYPNAGTMLMVTNDAQLNYALKNDWVDMAIPFHGDRPAMYKTGPERWTDYSGEQHETDIKTGKTAARIDAKDHSNNVDTYLQLVQERGALPRFARFIYDNNDLVIKHGINGVSSVTLKPGVTQPRVIEANKAGYMKLIRDIARTDSPHEVVQPNFDTKQAVKVLKQWEKGGGTHREAIPEVVKDMSKQLVQIAPAK